MITLFDKELSKFFSKRKDLISKLKSVSNQTDKLGKSGMNIQGFLYTEMKQPVINVAAEFKTKLILFFTKPPEEAYRDIQDYYNEYYMDKQRSASLHTNHNILEKNYMNEVYKYFRNNSMEPSVVMYRQDQVEDIIRKYIDYRVYIENLRDMYNDIVDHCKSIKDAMIRLDEGNYTPQSLDYAIYGQHSKNVQLEIPDGFIEALSTAVRIKITTVTHFMNMYMTIMSAKITAMKQSVYQNTALVDSFVNFAHVQESASEYFNLDLSYYENGYIPINILIDDIKHKFNLDINDVGTANNDNLSQVVTYLCNIPARVLSGFAIITKVICPISDMICTTENLSKSTISEYIELMYQLMGDDDAAEPSKVHLMSCIQNLSEILEEESYNDNV